MESPKYKRVLLKISGEALAGDASRGLDFNVIGGQWAQAHDRKLWIQVDGGIDRNTARTAAQAGADVLVAGSAVFGAADRGEAIAQICASAAEGWKAV